MQEFRWLKIYFMYRSIWHPMHHCLIFLCKIKSISKFEKKISKDERLVMNMSFLWFYVQNQSCSLSPHPLMRVAKGFWSNGVSCQLFINKNHKPLILSERRDVVGQNILSLEICFPFFYILDKNFNIIFCSPIIKYAI